MKQEFKISLPYKRMRLVSRGSLGEVFSAVDLEGRTLAIKRLRPILIYDREEREKLSREAVILQRLSGPYFPKWIGGDTQCEEPYLVMEWMEGQPISSLFPAQQKKDFNGAFRKFAASCLSALKVLQDLEPPEGGPVGLIHADLNPKNILVGLDGMVRIFDFSHGVWVREEKKSLGGTRGYMGLEQMAHGEVSLGTDLFAMGLLWAEILRGAPLLSGKTLFAIFLELRDMDPEAVVEGVTSDPTFRKLLLPLMEPGTQSARDRLLAASQALLAL